jgi:hypothetical protein
MRNLFECKYVDWEISVIPCAVRVESDNYISVTLHVFQQLSKIKKSTLVAKGKTQKFRKLETTWKT